jgi:hypothetical protein
MGHHAFQSRNFFRRVGEEGHETGIADKPRQVIFFVAEEVPLILTCWKSLDEMWLQNCPGRKGFTTVSSHSIITNGSGFSKR